MEARIHGIISYICSHPNTKLLDVSIADNFSVKRIAFTILNPQNSSLPVSDIVRVTGYGKYLKLIHGITGILRSTINTARYPIHIIGLGFTRRAITQLKVYYMLRRFDKEALRKEVVMGKIDQMHSWKAIKKILKELRCEDQIPKVENIFAEMSGGGFTIEFLGLNLERGKSPSLKLYFKPKADLSIKANRNELSTLLLK